MRREALVLGGGVIGLTTALRLLEAGCAVRVWAAAAWPATVSHVAAAIWFPYHAFPPERIDAWGARTFAVLAGLADDPATGVVMRPGRVIWRSAGYDPTRIRLPGPTRDLPRTALPAGYRQGLETTVPVVEMPRYLPWLEARVRDGGGGVERRAALTLGDAVAASPLVFNCTGLGARDLVPDRTVQPVRGQVVRVENPGIERFTLDEDSQPVTYIVPRSGDVVLGGTAEVGRWSLEPDAPISAAILERCLALEPRLAGARVLGHAVGLRPGRPAVRLEVEELSGGCVVHNYGHGGSGVTVSWGCAEEAVRLARVAGALA